MCSLLNLNLLICNFFEQDHNFANKSILKIGYCSGRVSYGSAALNFKDKGKFDSTHLIIQLSCSGTHKHTVLRPATVGAHNEG